MGRADAEALDRAVARVVDTANCSGCGACTQLDAGLAMALDAEGYARPVRGTAAPAPRCRRQYVCMKVLVSKVSTTAATAAVQAAATPADRAVALSELSYLLNDNVEVITAPPKPAV